MKRDLPYAPPPRPAQQRSAFPTPRDPCCSGDGGQCIDDRRDVRRALGGERRPPLSDQRDKVDQQISSTKSKVYESSNELDAATAKVRDAEKALATAQNKLDQTRKDLDAAQQQDQAMALTLAKAREDLEVARAAVAEGGQKNVDAKQQKLGEVARQQQQQQTTLVSYGMLANGKSSADISNRIQWARNAYLSTDSELSALKQEQTKLTAAREAQAAIEQQASTDRETAAKNLERTQRSRPRPISRPRKSPPWWSRTSWPRPPRAASTRPTRSSSPG